MNVITLYVLKSLALSSKLLKVELVNLIGTTLVIPLLSIPTLTMLLVNVGSAKLQYACTIKRAITANIRHLYFSKHLLISFIFITIISLQT